MSEATERALTKARARLSGGGANLVEAEPILPPAELGAEVGYGLVEPRLGVLASVYVLPSWDKAAEVARSAPDLVGAGAGERVAAAQDGVAVLVIRADISGPDGGEAHDALSNLLSAFAGEE